MRRRLLSLAMALAMALSLLPTAAWGSNETAEGTVENDQPSTTSTAGTTGLSGSGTASDPYLISGTQNDLVGLNVLFSSPAPGNTIYLKIAQNFTLSVALVVPEGFTVDLDFAGNTIAYTGNGGFRNCGTLTVNDSSGNNAGGVTVSDGMSGDIVCLCNEGTAVINGGTYTMPGHTSGIALLNTQKDGSSASLTINDCIVNAGYRAVENQGGLLEINGGTFTSTSCNHYSAYAYAVSSSGTLYFNDGSVTGIQGALAVVDGYAEIKDGTFQTVACTGKADNCQNGGTAHYALYVAGEDGNVETRVLGGEFKSVSKSAIYVGNDNDGGLKNPATVYIEGGIFTAKEGVPALTSASQTGNPSITGGTFSTDVSTYCAPGLKATQNNNGTFSIVSDSTLFTRGTGTELDPFIISTVEQLQNFANSVNGTEGYIATSYAGQYIALDPTATFDLSQITWTPIGTATNPFSGHFDGRNAVITGLTRNHTGENDDIYYGLFGAVRGEPNEKYTETSDIFDATTGALVSGPIAEENYTAVVKNLTLQGVNIQTQGSKVGALIGESYHAYIANISVESGKVIGTNSVGGVLGRGYGTILMNVSTGASLTVDTGGNTMGDVYNLGGIAGSLREDSDSLSAAVNCENNATVTAYLSGGGIGGIVGQVSGDDPIVIYGCDNHGNITIKSTITDLITNAYSKVAGGIGGQIQGNTTNVIAYCSNDAAIQGGTASASAGALSGMANYYSGLIYDCSNSGTVSGYSYYSAGMVGHGGAVTVAGGSANTGAISTSLDGGYTSTMVAGASNTTYQDLTFSNVAALSDALVKAAKEANTLTDRPATMTLENVQVTNPSGELTLPAYLGILISDTQVCGSVSVSGSSCGNLTLGLPGAHVTVGSGEAYNGTLTLAGENMTFTNFGTLGTLIITGNDVIATNLGAMDSVKIANDTGEGGDNATFYNGTANDHENATLKTFATKATGTAVYNYGTINPEAGNHTLSFGTTNSTNDTTAIFHNYGTVVGGNGDSTYIVYAPGFANVKITNYAGSTMKPGHEAPNANGWFITYGYDGADGTTSSSTKGIFILEYASGTVKDYSDTTVDLKTTNRFVGINEKDLDLRVVAISDMADPAAKIGDVGYESLQAAIDAAADGQTITVMKDLVLDAPLDLDGTNLTIQGATKDVTISAGSTITDLQVIDNDTVNGLKLKDLTFTNAIIQVQTSGPVVVENCTFKDTETSQGDQSGVLNVYGVGTEGTGSLTVRNSTFQNLTRSDTATGKEFVGIYTQKTLSSIAVEDSVFQNIAGTALSLRDCGNITVTENTFENWAYGSNGDVGRVLRVDFTNVENQNLIFTENKMVTGEQAKESYVKITKVSNDEDQANLQLGQNYWDGMDPATGKMADGTPILEIALENAENPNVDTPLTSEELKENESIKGEDRYYLRPTMNPEDMNDYTPSVTPDDDDDRPSYSGGSSTPSYSNTIEVGDGGDVKVSPRTPEAGDTVTITPDPDAGYEVDEVIVTDRNGDAVRVTANRNGTYTFEQPRGRVTIEVTFVRTGDTGLPFIDVAANAWYYDAVAYAYENGLMSGTASNLFSPNATTTRGMIVTMLYRLEGEPRVSGTSTFDDVADGVYYTDAVIWANANGIVTGYDETTFGPNDAITREQMAAILYRYAQYKGYDTTQGGMAIREYADYEKISEYALTALDWAVNAGLVTGTTSSTLTPDSSAVRAQVATIFMRFMEDVAE